MKRLLYVLSFLSIVLASCNREAPLRELSPEEKETFFKNKNDSLLIIFDSLMSLKINIPPVIDKALIDSTCSSQFIELAKRTDGNVTVLLNAGFISKEIVRIIEQNAEQNTDIMFLIDKTGSMADDIDGIKKGLKQIISSVRMHNGTRLSIATYGDKNSDGKDWYSFRNFETNYGAAEEFIKSIRITGGDDYPESVYDGFYETIKEDFWRSETKRMIILIGDAPSLSPPKASYTIEDVIAKARENKITMNFYPIIVSPYNEIPVLEKRMEETKLFESIYPNPCSGPVSINFTAANEYKLEIFAQDGKQISSEMVNDIRIKKDLGELPNGVYIIRATDPMKNFDFKKIILQK